MHHKQYTNQLSSSPLGRTGMVTSMLNNSRPRRASVRGHVTLSESDHRRLSRVCDRLLYVTSTATMSVRLMSMLKYGLFKGHGNKTIEVDGGGVRSKRRRGADMTSTSRSSSSSRKRRRRRVDDSQKTGLNVIEKEEEEWNIIDDKLIRIAKRRIDRLRTQERFLERYPYNNNNDDDDERRYRLQPHYIIRREYLQGDTQALLRALGCGHIALRNDNVHTVVVKHDGGDGERQEEEEEEKDKGDLSGLREYVTRQMRYGNKRFQQLSRLAAVRNRRGLRLARTF